MAEPVADNSRAICDYEGSSYRADFWEGHGREYEDLAERIALKHLLPSGGRRILEVGAGFGRLADLYGGYEQVVLLDYAQSGLREARQRLGQAGRFLLVAADLYHLPLVPGTCDTVVTVRVLHHVVDVPSALRSVAAALRPDGTYVLEYANKRNFKAIARYVLGRQRWSPFDKDPYEFVKLNFDFHPEWMKRELARAGFEVEAGRAVSYFRAGALKRSIPAGALAAADGLLQVPGAPCKLTPSVFLRCRVKNGRAGEPASDQTDSAIAGLFQCPACGAQQWQEEVDALLCRQCGAVWGIDDGIYDFRAPRHNEVANEFVNW